MKSFSRSPSRSFPLLFSQSLHLQNVSTIWVNCYFWIWNWFDRADSIGWSVYLCYCIYALIKIPHTIWWDWTAAWIFLDQAEGIDEDCTLDEWKQHDSPYSADATIFEKLEEYVECGMDQMQMTVEAYNNMIKPDFAGLVHLENQLPIYCPEKLPTRPPPMFIPSKLPLAITSHPVTSPIFESE